MRYAPFSRAMATATVPPPFASRQRQTPEKPGLGLPGIVGLALVLVLFAAGVLSLIVGTVGGTVWLSILGGLFGVSAFVFLNGFFVIQPNQATVLVFLGRYRGTVTDGGWYWTNPFVSKYRISLRVRNFTTQQLKVNDADGNPIEIAAVIVWRVVDTARATFDVESYPQFVEVQSETAVRHLASRYPYDQGGHPNAPSLRGSADEVSRELARELAARLQLAGIEVVEARLSHLAYAPEIAGAMLQRQQAAAIIAAKERIATGAVGIVETVLESLHKHKVVELSSQQKAEMVQSLLVVLTSERGMQPVLTTARVE